MHLQLKDIYEKLHAKDYKVTPQRQVILSIFVNNVGKHLSADDVFSMVRQMHPEIGLATIYRTLDLLAEVEVLQRINFGDGRSRYELVETEQHYHHHLICLRCGKVQEFQEDMLEQLEDMVEEKSGFRITDHQVKFFGYCAACQQEMAESGSEP